MFFSLIMLMAGFGLLYVGAEALVRGASSLALRLGVAPLVVGLTIVAFGTSMPELVVSMNAALASSGGLALGNVIGSNICNIGLILGAAAVIRPLRIEIDVIRLQVPILLLASLALLIMLYTGFIGRIGGFLFFAGFICFTGINLVKARKEKGGSSGVSSDAAGRSVTSIFLVVAGLCLLVFGGNVFIRGAVNLARILQISESVIGLTIVAFGTSLPELATSVVAAVKGEADIATGNVIGSNIFNILAILGLTGLVNPFPVEGVSSLTAFVFSLTAVLLLPFFRTGFILSRLEGAFFLLLYVAYIVALFLVK